jgi:hypothetical protein
LGSGLGGIGAGLAGGLKNTATAPFAGSSNQKDVKGISTPEIANAQQEKAEEKKKAGPRKIEIRGEKA